MDPLDELFGGMDMNELVYIHAQNYKNYVYSLDQNFPGTAPNIPEVGEQLMENEQQLEIIEPSQIYISSQCVGSGFCSQVFIGTHNDREVACKRCILKGDMFFHEAANLKLPNPTIFSQIQVRLILFYYYGICP
ncbi:hypothetical protein DICPUDRAFT_83550 [Dictyostelium purpureum]|uniref:Uncharacterized protein n=1 Tax=Dictyostelium purpureum TaxID=5786 RepID=F0ZZV1_DICPU|nr:uncharacterized protein DICPUDRAFT_83550 [Dictyostelium purpureum]EGC30520.1 hypothetical protein DICPUDRAFT_83550 [Dictyostelium purpureum]|eukprot:XP_003292943.1 hypothetical protein DICPUDRAFT_83550 [Dictyostelium purpureum]